MKEKVTDAISNLLTVGFIGICVVSAIKIIENYWKEILFGTGAMLAPILVMGIYTKISETLEKKTGKTLGSILERVWGITFERLKHPFISIAIALLLFFIGKPIIFPNTARSIASNSYTVYVTNTGHKYHRSSCRYLRYSSNAIDLDRAVSKGYGACSVCRP